MSKAFPILTLLILSGLQAIAGSNALVQFPEGNTRWTIDITYPESAARGIELPENRMVRAVVTRRGDIRRDQIWWSKSAVTEVWVSISARLRVFENPENGGVYVIPFNDSVMTLFVPREFDDDLFDWVTPNLFVGNEKFEGRNCKVYAGTISKVLRFPGMDKKTVTMPPLPHKLWIDAETSLPVALDTGIAFHRFQFEKATDEPLVVPDKLQAELERYIRDLAPSKRIERLRLRRAGQQQ